MQIKTNIAKVIEEVSDKVKYDNEVKKVLSDPQILAWILKYTVREFSGYSIEEIMGCIKDKPEVAVHPVHPEHYTVPVEGAPTETTETAAQKVTYDIRFKVAVPDIGTAGMIINVEAQNKFYESYDLVSRGVFYCARMVSTQVRNEESAREYNHLQKVYSIWICLDVPVNSEYTITSYRMNRQDIYGHMASTANQRYDLMELVLVCLGRPETAKTGIGLHKLLTVVLSEELTPEEKKQTMQKEYNIVTTVELEGGLAKMCNLSEHIEERGIQQGVSQGVYQTLFSLVSQQCISAEKAAQEAGITLEEFEELYRNHKNE